MESYFWRIWARVIAFVEMIVLVLVVMAVITVIVEAEIADAKAKDEIRIDTSTHTDVLWWMWLLVALLALIIGLKLWASVKLLGATELVSDANEALGKARFWRNVTLFFFVLDVADVLNVLPVMFVYGFAGWFEIVWMAQKICLIIWRVIVLLIVYKYIEELKITFNPVGVGGAEAGAGHIYPEGGLVE